MRRRLAVWLVGSVLLAATVALVGCAVTATVAPVAVPKHVAFAAGTACDSPNCHDQFKHQEPYTGPCQLCHNTTDWTQVTYKHKDPTFDHGMHPNLGCATCHTEGKPLPSPLCSGCHTAPHKNGPVNCKMCHTTYAWRLFQLLPAGHVTLTGAHANLTCLDCHTAKVEPATPRTCVNCHGVRHGGLTDCADCHTPTTFSQTSFEHSTVFTLTGAHAGLSCSSCHSGIRFVAAVSAGNSILKAFDVTSPNPTCSQCHSPQHGGLTNCGSCHTTASFKTAPLFDHSAYFKLTGAHAKLACSNCHSGTAFNHAVSKGGGVLKAFNFTTKNPGCNDCHALQHGASLTEGCNSCHTTASFATAPLFKHPTFSVLTGAHTTLACSKCHSGIAFSTAVSSGGGVLKAFDFTLAQKPSPVCSDCHSSQHGESGPSNCATCHTTATFSTAPLFDHSAYFLLIGHHAVLYTNGQCSLCHTSGANDFTGAPTVCQGCHSTDCPHVGPSTCGDCHTPLGWDNLSNFTHPAPPFVPSLPLAHNWTDFGSYPSGCVGCHPGLAFPSYSCSTCHAAP